MKFTLDPGGGANLIRAYAADGIRVGDRFISSSCIVTAETAIAPWAPATLDELTVSHLEAIFALRPELVLVGTGARQRFASAEVRAAFGAQRIGVEFMDLGAACRTFNVLVQEERRVAAALFLK